MNKNIMLLLAILLVCLPGARSIGVTPGRTTIDFEPDLHKTVSVSVINNENKDFAASIYAKGELAEYVTLSTDQLRFTAEEGTRDFTYEVNLPKKVREPGTHLVEIVVRETGDFKGDDPVSIGAMVAVVSQLQINVPYPGKFLRIRLHITEAQVGKKVQFKIPVSNLGDEGIESARATVIIYDPDGNEVARVDGAPLSLDAKMRSELFIDWLADVGPGMYRAAVVVEYDGQRVVQEGVFLVGDFFLKPLDISVENFRLGAIAKFNILAENVGNIKIADATSRIILNDGEGRSVADIISRPVEIPPLAKREMYAYWDTETVGRGLYEGKVVLSYKDKQAERQIRTQVEEDSIQVEIIGITGRVISAGKPEGGPGTLKIIIGVLVIMNVLWMAYFRLRRQQAIENFK
ncbi:MAG: hypothetical protein ABH879_06325 [archaeon]